MLTLGFNERIDQLALVNSVHRNGYVLRKEIGHILKNVLEFQGQRKNGGQKGH